MCAPDTQPRDRPPSPADPAATARRATADPAATQYMFLALRIGRAEPASRSETPAQPPQARVQPCRCATSLRVSSVRRASAPKVQPITLIGKAHAQQQGAKREEADNAVALAERAGIHQKYLEYRNRQQHKSLPSQQRGLTPESDGQQRSSSQQK